MGAIRSRIIIAPVILSIAAGIMMVTRHRTRPDLTNAAISALGVVVTPQTVVVERTSPGSPAYVKFTLENIGHNAVRVESVDTTCGCSVAQPMADQIILARKRQQLAIVTDPPMFGSRNVAVHLRLADAKDASRTDEIWLQLKLVGKALAASRVYDIPKMIEVSSASSSEVSRQFEIKTVEENATRNWITGLSPTVPNIRADIIDSKTELRPNNRVYRTYVCRLIIDIPQEIEDTRAATVNLVSAVETAPVDAGIRVLARRRAAWDSFPSVINVPSQDSLDVLDRLVVIQARDPKDVDSLLRLQVSHVPKGIVSDWLPSEEIGLRKLLIRNSGEGNRSAGTELLSLRDPWIPEGLDIRLVSE